MSGRLVIFPLLALALGGGLAQAGAPAVAPGAPAVSPGAPAATPGSPAVAPGSPAYAPVRSWGAAEHRTHQIPGLGCEACHSGARAAVTAGAARTPSSAVCGRCHPRPQLPPALAVPAAIKLNHRLHLERGAACATCHGDPTGPSAGAELPHMSTCLGCHDGKRASARCSGCHQSIADGRLRLDLPGGRLVPRGPEHGFLDHGPTFAVDHRAAGRNERSCRACHAQRECVECHGAGAVRPFDIHPSDYVTLHAVDARRGQPSCSACHRSQTFCVGCHQRTGVGPDPENGVPGHRPANPFGTGTRLKQFHPPGWARDAGGAAMPQTGPDGHAAEARRNVAACVSCHREESCIACHSSAAGGVGGLGFSPHGPGFASTARCRALTVRNRRACLKCHDAMDPAVDCR